MQCRPAFPEPPVKTIRLPLPAILRSQRSFSDAMLILVMNVAWRDVAVVCRSECGGHSKIHAQNIESGSEDNSILYSRHLHGYIPPGHFLGMHCIEQCGAR